MDRSVVTIECQLERERHKKDRPADAPPEFAPTKSDRARTITLGTDTVTLLRAHKREQAELKIKNRGVYRDHGLVFSKTPHDLQTPDAALGEPCTALPESAFRRVIAAAGIRRIKFHGVRHTSATLLLGAGVPIQVVSQRLGQASVKMTLDTYAHAMPDMQKDAAARLGAVLYGAQQTVANKTANA